MGDSTSATDVSHLVGADRGGGITLTLFRRETGGLQVSRASLQPWLLTSRDVLPSGSPTPVSLEELDGTLPLRYLVSFSSWPDIWGCVRAFLDSESNLRGHRVYSFTELPYLFLLPDPLDQWLVRTGSAFFARSAPAHILRCTFAFSTDDDRPALADAEKPDARIKLVSLALGNGDRTTFRTKKKDEAGLLKDVIEFLAEKDPDLICGTELHTLYLPYFAKRCALLGIEPTLGRRNAAMRPHPATLFREAQEVPGRSVIDLGDLLLNSELAELVGFFRHLKVQGRKPPEPLISGIRSIRNESVPDRVVHLNNFMSEVLENLLPIIQSTSLTPLHVTRSSALTRSDVTFVRDALQQKLSLPIAGPTMHGASMREASYRTGIYTTVTEIVLAPVAWAALRLVPESLIQKMNSPMRERLEAIRRTELRLPDPGQYDQSGGISAACRLRHSRFYDELFAKDLAGLETQILQEAGRTLSIHNIRIIQHTDDSIICQLPDNARSSSKLFWSKVQEDLPHGLRAIMLDAFDDCISLGPRIFAVRTGTRFMPHRKARIPRFFEPFLRDFFFRGLECSLRQDWPALRNTYLQTLMRIRQHSWHVLDFSRQEALSESFKRYDELVQAGKRHPSAAYESLRTTNPDARAGTVVRFYITGTKKEVVQADHCRLSDEWDSADPDENTEYYLDRLAQCVDRFRILFEPDSFSRLFGSEDLFGFDPSQIHTVEAASDPEEDSLKTRPDDESTISLDLGPDA